ncbi:hypothetical protein VTN00DRAFT_4308 [Thermoascus crustaceus]|uniref:uncharacterized protein n=1 Tax=Thermoascus crustaceus TaxID=5088 RepID=UPI003744519C
MHNPIPTPMQRPDRSLSFNFAQSSPTPKNPPLVVRMTVKPIVEECYSLIDTMQRKGETGDMGIGTLETITRESRIIGNRVNRKEKN